VIVACLLGVALCAWYFCKACLTVKRLCTSIVDTDADKPGTSESLA
jgi:hypothetical protein